VTILVLSAVALLALTLGLLLGLALRRAQAGAAYADGFADGADAEAKRRRELSAARIASLFAPEVRS
jgi:H+/Cl- antiporter ClcA